MNHLTIANRPLALFVGLAACVALMAPWSRAGAASEAATATGKATVAGTAAPTADGATQNLEQYVVSSRKPFTDENVDIVRTMDDAQPYYILGSTTINDSGADNLEDFFKQRLTMDTEVATSAQRSSNGGGNLSAINLLGLGATETLILLNGRRMATAAGSGTLLQPSVNWIPLTAIDRVEVLPSSSAAIYGGSAVGGVVNVVLKHDYNGGNLTTSFNNTVQGNSPQRSVDAAYGVTLEGGKTHIMVAAHYSDGQALTNQDRPQFFEAGFAQILARQPSLLYSTTTPFHSGNTTNIASTTGGVLVLQNGTSLGSSYTSVPAGTTASTPSATLAAGLVANAGHYNTAVSASYDNKTGLLDYIGTVARTRSVLTTVRRDLGSNLEVFAEFAYGSSVSVSPFNAFGTAYYPVPATAPTNPFKQAVNVSFPSPVGAEYTADDEYREFTVGLNFKLPYDWHGEADYTWSLAAENFASLTGSTAAFNAALANGTVNPFVGSVSAASLTPYLIPYGTDTPGTLNDYALRLAGPLWRLPGGEPTLAFGAEHRKEGVEDYLATTPTAVTQNLGEAESTNSVYAEGHLPVIGSGNALPGIQKLDFQLAGRTELFNVGVGTGSEPALAPVPLVHSVVKYSSSNPTYAVRYVPIDGLTLRASYGTAFIPPSYSQLLPPQTVPAPANNTVVDPLRGNTISAFSSQVTGGNPALKPQTSNEWEAGVIFEPKAIKGLRFDVEYYHVNQQNVVIVPTAQALVSNPSLYASRLVRNPLTPADQALGYTAGAVTQVNISAINGTQANTDGFTVNADYNLATAGYGSFELYALGSIVAHYRQQAGVGAPLNDLVNQVAAGGPLKFKETTSLTWKYGPWSVGWNANYWGEYKQYSVGTQAYIIAQGSDKIPGQIYHNLIVGYHFGMGRGTRTGAGRAWSDYILSGLTLKVAVNDVFNKAPPIDIDNGYFTPFYYSQFGDPRMRNYQLTLSKAF
jgi:outer membrane receptor protein involved in Fe transport